MFELNEVAFERSRARPATHVSRGARRSDVLDPETFRERVEAETARHFRYLEGFALVRIGSCGRRSNLEALREAVETETRRTDAVCALPDGTFAILALRVGDDSAEALVRRLEGVATELARARGDYDAEFCGAIAAAGDRRPDPDDLWDALCHAFREAREMGAEAVFAMWDA